MIKITELSVPQNRLTLAGLEPGVLYRRFVGPETFEGYLMIVNRYYICFYTSGKVDAYTAPSVFDDNRFERVTKPVTLENIN